MELLTNHGYSPSPPRAAGRITQPAAASPLNLSPGAPVNSTLDGTSTVTLCSRPPGEQNEGHRRTRRLVWGQDLRFWVVQRKTNTLALYAMF